MKTFQEFINEWGDAKQDFMTTGKLSGQKSVGGTYGTNPNAKYVTHSSSAKELFTHKGINNAFAGFLVGLGKEFGGAFKERDNNTKFFNGEVFNADSIKPSLMARVSAARALAKFFNQFDGTITVMGAQIDGRKVKESDLIGKLDDIKIVT